MVSKESVESQLIRLGFNIRSWTNRAELAELPHILLPDEEIYECVNGYYEGGFALLVATNVRVLLIDKKPLNFLTVEDMRFDMINQLDYSHRMLGAQISISAGNKNLKFRSYNQARLRKLINHVQHCMAEIKKRASEHQEGQNQHLEQINQQLQAYLLAQYQSQMEFSQRLREAQAQGQSAEAIEPPRPPVIKPSPELSDFLYSQSLLREYGPVGESTQQSPALEVMPKSELVPAAGQSAADQTAELFDEGRREIFGNRAVGTPVPATPQTSNISSPAAAAQPAPEPATSPSLSLRFGPEVNPLSIAYSRLPQLLRSRKFGQSAPLQAQGSPVPINPPTPS